MSSEKRKSAGLSAHPQNYVRMPDRYQAFIDGTLKAEDLDLDELTRGQLKDINGHFRGRPPTALPKAFTNALARELVKRMEGKFRRHALDAIDTITNVMEVGEGASAYQGQKDGTGRLKAAQYVVERVMGKIPDKLELSATVTVWEGAVEGGELLVDVESDIIEAEVVPDSRKSRGPRTRPRRAIEKD